MSDTVSEKTSSSSSLCVCRALAYESGRASAPTNVQTAGDDAHSRLVIVCAPERQKLVALASIDKGSLDATLKVVQ